MAFHDHISYPHSDVYTGDLQDPHNIANYEANLQNNQFVVRNIKTSWDDYGTTEIVIHTKDTTSGGVGTIGEASTGGSASTTTPAPAPPAPPATAGGSSGSGLVVDEFGVPIQVQNGTGGDNTSNAPAARPGAAFLLYTAVVAVLAAAVMMGRH